MPLIILEWAISTGYCSYFGYMLLGEELMLSPVKMFDLKVSRFDFKLHFKHDAGLEGASPDLQGSIFGPWLVFPEPLHGTQVVYGDDPG